MINPFETPRAPQRRAIDPERFRELVERTDAQYDAMLYPGMPMEEAFRVEEARSQAHALIKQAAFELAAGEYRRP